MSNFYALQIHLYVCVSMLCFSVHAEMSINQEASLGVVVQQLVQCVNHHMREKGQLDLLVRRLDSIPEMNTATLKEVKIQILIYCIVYILI